MESILVKGGDFLDLFYCGLEVGFTYIIKDALYNLHQVVLVLLLLTLSYLSQRFMSPCSGGGAQNTEKNMYFQKKKKELS